jgi:hypothetical protein
VHLQHVCLMSNQKCWDNAALRHAPLFEVEQPDGISR